MSTRTSQRTARAASSAARSTQAQGPGAEVVDTSAGIVDSTDDVSATDVLDDALTDADDDASEDIFAQFMQGGDESRDRDEIIRELLASNKCKLFKGLHVKNVVAKQFDEHTLLTFVVKEWVIGDVVSTELDAFGNAKLTLGRTHNVQSSAFAVAGVAKDSPKGAIFAAEIVDDPTMPNMLYAGGVIDVIIQYVPAGEEYVNPFSSAGRPVTFERDKMIHHITSLSFGEVGIDKYHERLKK